MIRSIRGRIVLGSVAIAAAVLALLGVVVFEQLRHIAGAAVVTLAQEELRPLSPTFATSPTRIPTLPLRAWPSSSSRRTAARRSTRCLRA